MAVAILINVNINGFTYGAWSQLASQLIVEGGTYANNEIAILAMYGGRVFIEGAVTITGTASASSGGMLAAAQGVINMYVPVSINSVAVGLSCDSLASVITGQTVVTYGASVPTHTSCTLLA